MTILAEQRFDTQTDGSPVSVSAPWSTVGVAPTADAAAAAHGALGARWASTGTSGRLQYDFGSNQSLLVISSYFNVRTFSSVNHYIGAIYSLATGGTLQGDWRINTAHTVTIRDASTAAATSTATLSTGIWYRSEWKLDSTANTQELRIYVGEGAVPAFSLSGAYSSDLTRVPAVGPNVAAAGGAVDYDTLKLADDWVGPEVALTPVLHRYRYHNVQWV